jgi:hypothetical protein
LFSFFFYYYMVPFCSLLLLFVLYVLPLPFSFSNSLIGALQILFRWAHRALNKTLRK